MPRFSRPVARGLVAVAALLAVTATALALATEHFGHDPIVAAHWNFNPKVVEVANLPSRHYWHEINGDPTFFFRGNTDALNVALKKFAAVGEPGQEIVVLPGPTNFHNLTGERPVECDWTMRSPAGLYAHESQKEQGTNVLTKHPTLTVYVTEVAPAMAADAAKVSGWVADLDRDDFAARERAMRELEKHGHAAAPALRQSLTRKPSAEKRARIERLLGLLKGVVLEQVEFPAGVPVIGVDELLARDRAGLKNPNPIIRGMAAGALGDLSIYADDVVPTLTEQLKPEHNEYVRRSASGALSRLGRAALPALPVLQAHRQDADVNVRNAFEHVIRELEKVKDAPPAADESARKQQLREQIARYLKDRKAAG